MPSIPIPSDKQKQQQKLDAYLANLDENSSEQFNGQNHDDETASAVSGGANSNNNNNNAGPTSTTTDRELKAAQSKRAIAIFVLLIIFFIFVTVIIREGNDRSLFHFKEDNMYVTLYLKRICECNLTELILRNNPNVSLPLTLADYDNDDDFQTCKSTASIWPAEKEARNFSKCILFQQHPSGVCDDLLARTAATDIMIKILFGTFVIITVVSGGIVVVTVLQRLLGGLRRTAKLLRIIRSTFGPALVCAICFIPLAVMIGLAAAGILITLFLDTMCRETVDSYFVRPARARNEFGIGQGAVFILVGTFSGFIVLVAGTIWTVNSRKKLSELHAQKREEDEARYRQKRESLPGGGNKGTAVDDNNNNGNDDDDNDVDGNDNYHKYENDHVPRPQ